MYQVSTQQFTGPLDLLLQLVEKKNLEITELSLAQVTQEYVSFVSEEQAINPEDLADFLVIASTLLLIKSRSLLPSLSLGQEEETEIMDLETRLKLYKLYKEAGIKIKEMFKKEIFVLSRPSWKNIETQFSPPPHFVLENLASSFLTILQEIKGEETKPLAEKKIYTIISLEERIKELIERLTHGTKFNLKDLSLNKEDKVDLILTFLAVLHLAKQKIIKLNQNNNFDDIWITNQS
ncbi:MAG: segregation and condensation protein A [Minisyncoccia bacterium]